jgi:hypothetical protein
MPRSSQRSLSNSLARLTLVSVNSTTLRKYPGFCNLATAIFVASFIDFRMMDEVASSMAHSPENHKAAQNMDSFRATIYEAIVKETENKLDNQTSMDLGIQMMKRFPKSYQEE